jgi:hypothetical protein
MAAVLTLSEQEAYRPDKDYFLDNRFSSQKVYTCLKETPDIGDTALRVQYLGFEKNGTIPVKKGLWYLYSRDNYEIQNFPFGKTVLNYALAVYQPTDEKNMRRGRVILRASYHEINQDEFVKDVKKFTPLRWRALEDPVLIMGVPTLIGGAIGVVSNSLLGVFIGISAGLLTPIGLELGLHLSERIGKKMVPHLDEYVTGNDVGYLLDEGAEHDTDTKIKRELLNAVNEGLNTVPPEDVLKYVFPYMPEPLWKARKEEIERQITGSPNLDELVRLAQEHTRNLPLLRKLDV